MTTPLQQAAQALIDRWDSPYWKLAPTADYIAGLRKALDAELQQSVEPVAHFNMAINETVGCIAYEYGKHNLKSGTPLYLHPPQQVVATPLHKLIEGMTVSIDVSTGEYDSGNRLFGVVNEVMESSGDKNGLTLLIYETTPNFKPPQQVAVTSGERAELLRDLNAWKDSGTKTVGYLIGKAMDMLEADDAFRPDWVNYRQGVKDGKTDAQQAKQVPMSDEEIDAIGVDYQGSYRVLRKFARAIEAHHGITPK